MQEIIQNLKKGIALPELIDEAVVVLKQTLKESDDNFAHSLRTALILKEMGAEEITIACGILHHILPHLPESYLRLKKAPEIIQKEIVWLLKKVNQLRELFLLEKTAKPTSLRKWQKVFLSQQAENLRKMFFVVAQDLRPILVVLAGSLDELRNFLAGYSKEEQLRKGVAALEILAPLAYGLGMGEIKGEIEDVVFPYLYPKEYNWLLETVKEKNAQREKYVEEIKPKLAKVLREADIELLDTHARAKHYFSLYQKLLRYDMDIDKIYDLVALRVIVPNIESCYRALGAIHNVWRPLYGRIKDYISSPKPNGYRSLHTTALCPECGGFMEIQIKTPQMHKEAEYGAVAHLGYKEKIAPKVYQHQFYWLEQLRQWQEEIKDPQKIASYVQTNLFKNQIFVLTPKREIINLPKGATPVDFAYAVHSDIGEHCEGAKVNGKMVPLDYILQTGETIEILTDNNKSPSEKWLRFVKTHKAKQKIRTFLEKAHGISFAKPKREAIKEKVAAIKKVLPLKRLRPPQILIGGETGIAVRLSKCCRPRAGDNITAFITKGEGATVHKVDCANLKEIQEKWPQRIVQATWRDPTSS